MTVILSALLVLSLTINCIFVWYTRKIVKNLYYGVSNVEELQKLLNEYATLLEPLAEMENYYNDPVIVSAINNTKMVAAACKTFKNTIIESENEETSEEKEDIEKEQKKEDSSKQTKAVISSF